MEPIAVLILVAVAVAAGALGVALVSRTLQRRRAAWCARAAAAMVGAARSLGAAGEPLAAVPEALAGFGRALGCARLEVHTIHPSGGGSPLSSLRHAWALPGLPERLSDPSLRDRPWLPHRAGWLSELAAQGTVVAIAEDLSGDEREELAGHRTMVLVPVMVAGRLWGYLACFDQAPRRGDQNDGALLRFAAEFIASALARAEAASQLSAARTEAVSGDRAKREFLANISHEVRTPLNGVLGMSGLLLDTELDPRQRECAQVVRSSAENLLALLNDLIDLAKAEGEQHVERTRFEPVRLAEDVVAMLSERAHAKGVEIAVHPVEGLPRRVLGDGTRLRQVLVNLVGNAIKFTGRGHVVVRVDWSEDAGGTLSYAVHDSGIGIEPKDVARLFTAFSQGDGSSTRRFGGTGLGLAICRRMVEIMSGSIGCHSTPGEGSVFTVRVPASEGSSGAASRSSLLPGTTLGARVLVVEADAATRAAVAAVCRRIGLVPEEASGCPEAMARLSALGVECPRLVLLAANLPGASDLPGRLPSGPPCVLLSTVARRPTQTEVTRLGFVACLVKPPRTARLAEVVARALGHHQDEATREETGVHRRTALRVLVVEDDAINQRLAKAVLEREGLRCDVAGDGHEALEALARARYDAVLMDLLMPVMDGFACASEIRRLERERGQPAIPILAVTALDAPDIVERCRAAGMDGQVGKPFEPRHLRRVLRRLLQERRQVG